jgi:hypothetical protein
MEINLIEIAWLAGLVEGEGSISSYGASKTTPRLRIWMTDKDVIEKAANLMGAKIQYRVLRVNWKPQWGIEVGGHKALSWMFIIYKFMGIRRQEAIRNVVSKWKSVRANPKGLYR